MPRTTGRRFAVARTTLVTVAAVALAMLAGVLPAQAQDRYDFKVPFAFNANGKTFAAGEYALNVSDSQDVVTLQAKDPKAGSAMLAVETRISERKPLKEPEVVFDKLDGKYLVSELLVPGVDGYLFLVTKAKHTHESLKGAGVKK
jgi:hypothetical protein